MQQHLELPLTTPKPLLADLALLLRDVPPEQLAGKTEAELRTIIDDPLVRAALEKFRARIVNIEIPQTLQQGELF